MGKKTIFTYCFSTTHRWTYLNSSITLNQSSVAELEASSRITSIKFIGKTCFGMNRTSLRPVAGLLSRCFVSTLKIKTHPSNSTLREGSFPPCLPSSPYRISRKTWSPSYFAISVGGAPLEVLKDYIKNQEKPS